MSKLEIKKIIQKAIKKAFPEVEMPAFEVEYTNEKFGDFSTNAAMIFKKRAGETPEKIAQKIIQIIRASDNQIIREIEFINGFINFRLTLPFWQEKILEILKSDKKYAQSDLGKDLKVNIEFISANPTGPLTLGNGRGGYAGDVLARVFEIYDAQVEREYYINDCGAQIKSLGHSILKDAQAVYRGFYIDEIAPKIKSRNADAAGFEAATLIMEEYIKKTIEKMGIKFDRWFSQKRLFDDGRVSQMIAKLKEKGLCYKKDGALWLKTTEYQDDKDRVLVTAEGEHTYFASDIAYHFDKIQRGYDLLVDFWGADHHGYIKRMQAATEILRQEEKWNGKLEILICQLVRLVSKGKEIRMSKRQGTYVTLDELIDEVGADATRFFFLKSALNTHLDFDLDLARARSEKNPVYYVQYAHARIHSILAKTKNQKPKTKMINQNLKLLKHPAEIDLIKELTKLPDLVLEIVEDFEVQKLPFYAIELADAFHRFYEECPILKSEENLKSARLQLLKATQIVLKKTFDLMGISAPERM